MRPGSICDEDEGNIKQPKSTALLQAKVITEDKRAQAQLVGQHAVEIRAAPVLQQYQHDGEQCWNAADEHEHKQHHTAGETKSQP